MYIQVCHSEMIRACKDFLLPLYRTFPFGLPNCYSHINLTNVYKIIATFVTDRKHEIQNQIGKRGPASSLKRLI